MRVSDLIGVAHSHDFAVVADTSEDGFGLVALHILEFVIDNEAAFQTASAHKDGCLEFKVSVEVSLGGLFDVLVRSFGSRVTIFAGFAVVVAFFFVDTFEREDAFEIIDDGRGRGDDFVIFFSLFKQDIL